MCASKRGHPGRSVRSKRLNGSCHLLVALDPRPPSRFPTHKAGRARPHQELVAHRRVHLELSMHGFRYAGNVQAHDALGEEKLVPCLLRLDRAPTARGDSAQQTATGLALLGYLACSNLDEMSSKVFQQDIVIWRQSPAAIVQGQKPCAAFAVLVHRRCCFHILHALPVLENQAACESANRDMVCQSTGKGFGAEAKQEVSQKIPKPKH